MNESAAAQEWSAVVRIADVSADRRQLMVSAAAIWHARDAMAAVTRERDEARALNAESFCCGGDDACAGGTGCQCHALRAEVERLTGCLKRANDQAEEFERRWYLRGDEVEQFRKDAARYQWLRDPNNDTEGTVPFLAGDDLDAAIDAAIAQEGKA